MIKLNPERAKVMAQLEALDTELQEKLSANRAHQSQLKLAQIWDSCRVRIGTIVKKKHDGKIYMVKSVDPDWYGDLPRVEAVMQKKDKSFGNRLWTLWPSEYEVIEEAEAQ
jgi:hypothetical protein